MPVTKNALIRYKTIDRCLSNPYRRWTLEDLVVACSEALYEAEGIGKGVSVRTVQADLQMMRSDKLGYNAPIEVYDHKFYRYSDPDFSITNMPLSANDIEVLKESVETLRQLVDFDQFAEMSDVVNRLQEKIAVYSQRQKPIVHFDTVPTLKGIQYLSSIYGFIKSHQTLRITYRSFSARRDQTFDIYPYLLKEFRNRWFLFGARAKDMKMFNFALDRIISIQPIELEWKDKPEFDSAHFFDDVIGVSKNIGNRPCLIRLWADRVQRDYILTKPIHQSQQLLEQHSDGSIEFTINVVVNFELYSVLLSYGPGLKVISPGFVRTYMSNQVRELFHLYE